MSIDLSALDDAQRSAVTAPDGPVLVFAGAGSGKTRTLTHRVAWLIEQGVPARSIMAVTFTKKAAGEMKERLADMLSDDDYQLISRLRVGTFHAQMAIALRRYPAEVLERVGRSRGFGIWDDDDSAAALGRMLKALGADGIDTTGITKKTVARLISKWVNDGLKPADKPAPERPRDEEEVAAYLWPGYEELKRSSDAMDFDDLLTVPVELLSTDDELRTREAGSIRHLLVDEFQDTNLVQLKLVELLSSEHGNLFVVGDDAQSIYAFRGARIENILRFNQRHPDATVVTLDTNYRSTQQICDVANLVLAGSSQNIHKQLHAYRATPAGSKPLYIALRDDVAEAAYVARLVGAYRGRGLKYDNMAVLVRKHAQSRLLEEACFAADIPYRLLGGAPFWERREVRDLMAWIRVLLNPRDAMALRRALTAPARGIGDKTVEAVLVEATINGDPLGALHEVSRRSGVQAKARNALREFVQVLELYAPIVTSAEPQLIVRALLDKSGLKDAAKGDAEQVTNQRDNLEQVVAAAAAYPAGGLASFVENVTLADRASGEETKGDRLTIATIHAAKGLEWPVVTVVGCEEGLLPSQQSIGSIFATEEERRLFYVAVTRAKRTLVLTSAARRNMGGSYGPTRPSRFARDAKAALQVNGRL